MRTEVTATFVGGVFKPDDNLPLPERTRVKLTIETLAGQAGSAPAWHALKARIGQRPVRAGGKRFTRDELHERG